MAELLPIIIALAVMWTAFGLAKAPAYWIGSEHRQRLTRQYARTRLEGELLVQAWRRDDRAAAMAHLATIRAIEQTLRVQHSFACRLTLAAWAFAWSIAFLLLLQMAVIGFDLLPDGDTLIGPIVSLRVVIICCAILAATWAWHEVVIRTLLPAGAGHAGDAWASEISERLEAERVFDLQAKANAEEVVRYRERQEAEARAKAEWDRRQQEEAERFDRFRREQSARDRARAEEEAKSAQKQREFSPEVRSSIDLLKVQADYTLDDINTARRAAVKKLHPDISQKVTPRTRSRREEKLKAVNHAYDVLKKRVT